MVNLPQSGSTYGAYPVYTGFWTDWSRGKVLGSTLTLTREDANLLIAFVAFFLTVVTAQLWSIACFASHSFLSTQDPRDMLHHQRQAILRNNGAPAGTALTLIRLAWAWRRGSGVVRRVVPLFACTIVLAIGFAAAAGFSSRIALGNTVLLSPRNCGFFNTNVGVSPDTESNIILPWQARQFTKASNYAEQCYSTSGTAADCLNGAYVKRELAVSVDKNAVCPFGGNICPSNSSNIRLDSGFIDSHFDLGVNAPPNQRFQFKMVLHCAPLKTKGYRSFHTRDNQTVARYYYGSTTYSNYTYEYRTPDQFITASIVDENQTQLVPLHEFLTNQYSLASSLAAFYNGSYSILDSSSSFLPIPELSSYGSDIYIIFLSPNQVLFPQPTADPWYNSSKSGSLWAEVVYSDQLNESYRGYISTEAASPLGCTHQEQYCFPKLPGGQNCTPLTGARDSGLAVQRLGLNNETLNRLFWVHNSFIAATPTVFQTVGILGGGSLNSRFKLSGELQGFLPPDQWQLDVQNWNSIVQALFQQSMISTTLGDLPEFSDADAEIYVVHPESDEEKTICSSQKINSAYHVSFSVVGIAVIAIIGLFVIVTSLTVESITHFIQRRLKRSAYRRLEWISTGTLQLQRQLYEAHGIDEWRNCDEAIPILEEEGALLPVLDISDETHPLTKRRSQFIRDRKQPSTEGPSGTELPDVPETPDCQGNRSQEMTAIEQHQCEAIQHDTLIRTEMVPVNERTSSPDLPIVVSEPRDYRVPVSVQEALERRTSTYP
ncbi:hypothetical protein F5B22DRAFT_545558 [Xylaria bambusicola]|uniref:uncharacterized protein n=1 Tax=Xylaria bambusicola TaxID=326684 RepID=UPI002007F1BC|nr:uncharacterized protein F5B22DRAFT_545558 [Xylaria bambusicola]KAI0521637.1 hypothetical protein F5B22DRAFT_545558 [Xylaria bambusicola]